MFKPYISFTFALLATITPQKQTSREDVVEVQIRNVDLRLDADCVLQIRSLRGQMIATGKDIPVTFDDKNSYVTKINSGELAVSTASLSSLLNKHVFAYAGAPLKNISISTDGNRIKQKGTMHKGVDMPFELEGTLSATPEGQIRFHADKIKSAHVAVKGLLHLFGKDLSKLINVKEAQGVKVVGDDIILFPDRMIPAPRIQGKVVDVRVEGNDIVQIFGAEPAVKALAPPWKAKNYIYHRGGTIRFGKLTMQDSDLQIVDLDAKTPFEFYLDRYLSQLVAGYSKTTADKGLIVFMPDYAGIGESARAQ